MSDHTLSQEEIAALLAGNAPEDDQTKDDVGPDESGPSVVDELLGDIAHGAADAMAHAADTAARVSGSDTGLSPYEAVFQKLLDGRVAFSVQLSGAVEGAILYSFDAQTAQAWSDFPDKEGGEAEEDEETKDADLIALPLQSIATGLAHTLATYVTEPVDVHVLDLSGETPGVESGGLPDIAPTEQVYHYAYRIGIGDAETELLLVMTSTLAEVITASMQSDTDRSEKGVKTLDGTDAIDQTAADTRTAGAPVERKLGQGAGNLDLLLDVPLQVTVELGRTRMQIRDVLALGKGSVIELDKLAGEAVEVYVNGKLVAKGEVVTIDENFGVKITDIISRPDRVNARS